MQKTVLKLILFCVMQLSCPASGGQRHGVQTVFILPFILVMLYEKLLSVSKQLCAKCKDINVLFFFFLFCTK